MVASDFDIDDLVWAKMKGYPSWPAKVVEPPPGTKVQKKSHYVFFFGTKNYAWILDENISLHSEDMVQQALTAKKKSAIFLNAIDELRQEIKTSSKKVKPLPKVKVESPKKSPDIIKKPGKKAVKAHKPSIPKKPAKKRRHSDETESSLDHYPSPKTLKAEHSPQDSYAALRDNIPPYSSGSRVGVNSSYDDDSKYMQTAAVLTKRDYFDRPATPTMDLEKISETLQAKNIVPTTKKIGFLGLGLMGRGIVKNLMNSNHNVTIWNRTPEKCLDFEKAGATRAQTPADVVQNCDITFCCVSDPEAAKYLVFGNCGVLKGLEGSQPSSKGYVEMTSIDPTTSQEIAEAVTHKGGRYLEAPVSGSRQLAEEGSLLVLGAGDRELFNECETCFFAISKNAYYLSCVIGNGSMMNLALSMLMGSAYAALGESMALIERCNLSQANFLEILAMGPINCNLLLDKGQAMHRRNFSTNTALKHQQKDLHLALRLGETCDQPLLLASAANEIFKHAKLLSYADHDVSAVLLGAKY